MLLEKIAKGEITYLRAYIEFFKYLFKRDNLLIDCSKLNSSLIEYGISLGLINIINSKVDDSKATIGRDNLLGICSAEIDKIAKLKNLLIESESSAYRSFVNFINSCERREVLSYKGEIGEIKRIRTRVKEHLDEICYDPVHK